MVESEGLRRHHHRLRSAGHGRPVCRSSHAGAPMFAGYMSGGQLMLTSDIENFPAIQRNRWSEMMMELREQADIDLKSTTKRRLCRFEARPFAVSVEGQTYHANVVTLHRCGIHLARCRGRGGTERTWHQHVRHLRRRLLPRGRGHRGRWWRFRHGRSHLPDPLCVQGDLVHRRDVFRASQVMYDRAAAHPKIEIKTFRQVDRWLSDDKGPVEPFRGPT